MPFSLGVNTNAFVNRIVEPERLVPAIVEEIGLKRIQLTPEILSPDWPAAVILDHVRRWNRACERHGGRVTTTFTGNYTRLNSLCHPDPGVRAHWRGWLERLIDITADLGAVATGSQIGILTYADDRDPVLRAERFAVARDHWHELAAHAKARGLTCLMWEPMSISREFGQTIAAAKRDHAALNEGSPLPILINADIDHGDVTSSDPADTDPYAWARELANSSPVVHIKQSTMDKGGHRPFTAAYNEKGRVVPKKLVRALEEGGGTDNELVFEFTFREREPTDSEVVAALKESVDYWRGWVALD
jgi:sugar phosphate isomerase/epimerase